ncbi:MAG: PAS domain S-box protein [Chloroflexi bacterium]|nr:PAS domain S-box protein [Chloroflexota bacterium]
MASPSDLESRFEALSADGVHDYVESGQEEHLTLEFKTLGSSPFQGRDDRRNLAKMYFRIRLIAIEFGGERCLLAVARDVSTIRQTEDKLRRSEERLSMLFEFAPDSVYLNDLKGNFIDGNAAAEELTGYKRDELIGKNFLELGLLPADQIPKAAELLAKGVSGRATGPDELTLHRKDGSLVTVEIRTFPVTLNDESLVLGIARDITERKQTEDELRKGRDELEARVDERTSDLLAANERLLAEIGVRTDAEKALRDSEERLRNMFEVTFEGLVIHDNGTILDANPAFEELVGYTLSDLRGRSLLELVTEESRDAVRRQLSSPPGRRIEVEVLRQDGPRVYAEATGRTWTYQGRKVRATSVRDITERRRAEKALRESEERYRSLYLQTPSAVYSIDREGRIIEVSEDWLDLLGYERKEVIGRRSVEFLTDDSRRRAETTALPEFWKTGRARNISFQFRRKNGEIIDVLLSAFAIRNEEGEFIRSLGALTDVTGRRRAEQALRESEEKFRLLAENAVDIVYRYRLNPDPGYEYISPAVTATTGYKPDEFYADPDLHWKIVHPDDLATQHQLLNEDLPGQHVLRWLHKSGSIVWMELTEVPIYSDDGTRVALEGVARDITTRKRAEATIEHMAYHDSLTGLPNRALLKDRLELAIAQAQRSGRKVAAMFLDVDRFKVINDTLGHPSGDKLLQRIGKQLTRVVRDGDTVARVGGDEFILLLPDLEDPEDAKWVAERVLQRIGKKRVLAGRELVVTASLGISVYPSDGDDAETLLSHADTAMYKAKDQGRNQFEFYDSGMGANVLARFELEGDLRRALARDEFVEHYQPQIAIDSGEIVGAEVLVRWQHPERGLLMPDEFLDVAQDAGLILRLDERTLRAASSQCVAWQRAHSPSLHLCVNFETNALLDRDFPRKVESILRSSGLAPANLMVEITEQHAVRDIPSTQAVLRELKTMGVQIAVDDFGAGHSSLAYLSQFPIDVVKIDRTFVGGIGRTPEDSAIVVAIVSMARGLGLKVIAEGVETEEQLALLKALRCDEYQGYLFSKAVPPQEFEKLLSASNRSRSGRDRGS